MDKSTFLPTILMAPCCEWSPPNSEQWAIARRVHSPPSQGGVAAPLIKRSRSLAAQTGWFVISNKIRIATRAYTEATRLFTNHPRPLRGLPSFERRGIDSLQQLSSNRAQACA